MEKLHLLVHEFGNRHLPADGNASKHTIAAILMHDKARLNHARFLMSVWHNTTDEGRISSIQSFHQVIKLTLVKRRHCFSSSLLPWATRVLGSLCRKIMMLVASFLYSQTYQEVVQDDP